MSRILRPLLLGGAVTAALGAGGCKSTEAAPLAESVITTVPIDAANSLRLGWLIAAGQPDADDFAALAQDDVTAVINLRQDSEMESLDFNEEETVEALGMRYVSMPIGKADTMTDAVLDATRAVLREQRGKPTVLHCRTANRVGGPLIAYLVLDEGMDPAEAVDTAKQLGLKSPEIEARALEYVAARKK